MATESDNDDSSLYIIKAAKGAGSFLKNSRNKGSSVAGLGGLFDISNQMPSYIAYSSHLFNSVMTIEGLSEKKDSVLYIFYLSLEADFISAMKACLSNLENSFLEGLEKSTGKVFHKGAGFYIAKREGVLVYDIFLKLYSEDSIGRRVATLCSFWFLDQYEVIRPLLSNPAFFLKSDVSYFAGAKEEKSVQTFSSEGFMLMDNYFLTDSYRDALRINEAIYLICSDSSFKSMASSAFERTGDILGNLRTSSNYEII